MRFKSASSIISILVNLASIAALVVWNGAVVLPLWKSHIGAGKIEFHAPSQQPHDW
jgi:hypothetical protein